MARRAAGSEPAKTGTAGVGAQAVRGTQSERSAVRGTAGELSAADALAARMASLLLRERSAVRRPVDVAGVVGWFGAMQAQDHASILWSLGARLPGYTEQDVHAALERREAVRTWPMRGTVHLVPAADAHWMVDILGRRALAGAAARRAYLGLSDATAERAVEVLAAALAGGGRFTRSQCLAALGAAGIDCTGQLGYHILWYASQLGVTCIAPHIGKEQSFVLLDEWVPEPRRPDEDEALGTIALRYFRSHGPTTRQDFAGWTGLTATEAKRGIAVAGADLTAVRVAGAEMYMDAVLLDECRAGQVEPLDDVLALPGFDEYMLGFKDRALMLAPEHKQAIIPGGNGVFQPTVVRAGRVVATWRRSVARGRVSVRVQPLVTIRPADRKRVERAFEPYAGFIGGELQVSWA